MTRIEDFRRVYAGLVATLAEVGNPRIAEAFARVPRERYLGPGPWQIMYERRYVETPSDDPAFLYHNHLVAIDAARELNNGEPQFLARLIDALAPQPGEHVVHVGTGTGYYTAILAELVGPNGRVTAIEVDPALAARSRDNLSGYATVEVATGSGTDLKVTGVDGLYINAGASHPRDNWLDALAPGGRLVLPITRDNGEGLVVKITRLRTAFAAGFVSPTGIYPCQGGRDPEAVETLERAFRGAWDDKPWRRLQSLRRDPHEPGPGCWLHGSGYCFSTEPPAPTAH